MPPAFLTTSHWDSGVASVAELVRDAQLLYSRTPEAHDVVLGSSVHFILVMVFLMSSRQLLALLM